MATRVPTIFFINWHGRRDFRVHVYEKTGEPDPDTGYDFGALNDDRKMVAWGGMTPDDEETGLGGRGVHRVWFYDLSAGPEAWAGNYDVDNPDLDGDDVADCRIPVAWEYGSVPPALGAATRPRQGRPLRRARPPVRELAALPAVLHGGPRAGARRPRRQQRRGLVRGQRLGTASSSAVSSARSWPSCRPATTLASDDQDLPFAGDFRRCYVDWLAVEPCFRRQADYSPEANLFLAAALNTSRFLDREPDYEAGLIN